MSSMDVASLIGLIRSEIRQQSTNGGGVSTSSQGASIPSHSSATTSIIAPPIVSPSLSGMIVGFNSVFCFVLFLLAPGYSGS